MSSVLLQVRWRLLSSGDWLATQVNALEAFHDARMNADEAALSMTRPLSVSPVPALGDYSDEILAVCKLWRVIIAAPIE